MRTDILAGGGSGAAGETSCFVLPSGRPFEVLRFENAKPLDKVSGPCDCRQVSHTAANKRLLYEPTENDDNINISESAPVRVIPLGLTFHRRFPIQGRCALRYVMSNEAYSKYLNSGHWLNLRQRKLIATNRTCQVCGWKRDLQCHHIRYLDLVNCTLDDLLTLCERCHKAFHAVCRDRRINPQGLGLDAVRGLIHSYVGIPKRHLIPIDLSEEGLRANFREHKHGWTRERLACFGIGWPPPKGWRRELRRRFRQSKTGKPQARQSVNNPK